MELSIRSNDSAQSEQGRTLPLMPPKKSPTNYDDATRAQVLAYKVAKLSNAQIYELTGLEKHTVNAIVRKAKTRGFDPDSRPARILDEHVTDGKRSGRPAIAINDAMKELVLSKVLTDRFGREKSCAYIAQELSKDGHKISKSTVWKCLRLAGYKKTKPTRKPGLTQKMKDARLAFCEAHKHWTLDDWKNVIWSDETSVVLGHRRGGYKVWRTSTEVYTKSCIRPRWKGYSEFMFWGCFSYDFKGPCHIWQPETATQKTASQEYIDKLNTEIEPTLKQQWQARVNAARDGLRKPGKTPEWKFTKKQGKLERGKGNGIDWFRYQTVVVKPKLIPFAEKCIKHRPGTIVQEDNAPAHAHHAQSFIYNLKGIIRLLWPGNSPDLNCIEPAWFDGKVETTKHGAPTTRKEAQKAWRRWWSALSQEKIQRWIERIVKNIPIIIALEGDNNYEEAFKAKRVNRPPPVLNPDYDWYDIDDNEYDSDNTDEYIATSDDVSDDGFPDHTILP